MILENKLKITDQIALAKAEEKISKQKAKQLFDSGDIHEVEAGTFAGLAFIHAYLFGDRASCKTGPAWLIISQRGAKKEGAGGHFWHDAFSTTTSQHPQNECYPTQPDHATLERGSARTAA